MRYPCPCNSAVLTVCGREILARGDIMKKTRNVLVTAAVIGATAVTTLGSSLAQPVQTTPTQPSPTQSAPVQPVPRRAGPCAQITAACQQAGFVRNGAKSGVGIVVDCIRPIMAGLPLQGTKSLPPMDPQVVAACKQQNPNFGMPRRAQPTTKPPG
jgi:hypothetical protein